MKWTKDGVPAMRTDKASGSLRDFCPLPVRRMWRRLAAKLGDPTAYAREHDCIFVHIPRTVGNSVAEALFRGEVSVDFVGRFETLADDFHKICERLDVVVDLPHLNASRHSAYDNLYNSRTREIVGEVYRKDCELFDYRCRS